MLKNKQQRGENNYVNLPKKPAVNLPALRVISPISAALSLGNESEETAAAHGIIGAERAEAAGGGGIGRREYERKYQASNGGVKSAF